MQNALLQSLVAEEWLRRLHVLRSSASAAAAAATSLTDFARFQIRRQQSSPRVQEFTPRVQP
jgi:hypothetical protein